MADFIDDETVRMHRTAKQHAADDIEVLKSANPLISPEEESDTWRSLYMHHLNKLRRESTNGFFPN